MERAREEELKGQVTERELGVDRKGGEKTSGWRIGIKRSVTENCGRIIKK